MKAPLVSVIMPLRNAASFVEDAIRSVLAQTESDLELIVVDDASSDGSGDLVRAFSDGRLRLLRGESPLSKTRMGIFLVGSTMRRIAR